MKARLVFCLLMFFCVGSLHASLLSSHGLPAQYMQTTEDAVVWA